MMKERSLKRGTLMKGSLQSSNTELAVLSQFPG
jgi:hypothetical protein